MSVATTASHGSSEGDILTQALLQTGVSTPVKLEAKDSAFDLLDESLLSCDVQTLTEDLISKLESPDPAKETLFPPPAINSVGFATPGGQPAQNAGRNESLACGLGDISTMGVIPVSSVGNFTNNTLSTPGNVFSTVVKTENPPHPTSSSGGANNFGDIELEDLLAITVEQPGIDLYQPPVINSDGQTQPGLLPSNSQTSFPNPAQYNSTYQPPSRQPTALDLPELMCDDFDSLLNDAPNIVDSFPSVTNIPYPNTAANSSYMQQQRGQNTGVMPGESRITTFRMMQPPHYAPTTPSSSLIHHTHTPAGPQFSTAPRPPLPPPARPPPTGYSQDKQNLLMLAQQRMQKGLVASSPAARLPPTRPVSGVAMSSNAVRLPPTAPSEGETAQDPMADSDDEDEEEFANADTYANYVPTKVKIGITHPDAVVESSSLSSVDPPDVFLSLKLPQETIESGKLSSLQLESVIYASQQHMNILPDSTRAGFLVGDGAGVGKGRIIAGIIYQNYLEGRKKAIWLSVSNDLRLDAARDLKDIGAKKIDIYSLNKFHYGKISGKRNGRVRKGIIFATYSSLIGESTSGGKYRTRFDQLIHWLGSGFEGVIVFDECHKAKNLVPSGAGKPSKTGLTVLKLQKKLPKARIVYCSATGASEPKNMAYMSRLGIWGKGTQFNDFQDFIKAVERRGVGAMEIVAIDMKLRGMYLARQLSFGGVTFSICEVELTDKFVEAYDASVKLWAETRRLFQEAAELLGYDKQKLKTMWGQFWAAHQRFFKYMCIAAKVPETIRQTKRALEDGKCVVIGLQSTGEARTLEQLERSDGELSGFISTTKGVLDTLIRRHFPTPAPVPGLLGIDWNLVDNDPTLPRSCRRSRTTRKTKGVPAAVSDSDSEESFNSPERSDSAMESSSDEGEQSSDGSGSSSSESEGEEDNDINPFGNDFSEPWLQKKKAKPKSRKRQWSPASASSNPSAAKRRKRNFSIKPPPHSSSRTGKTKTGFNSKKLKFENVQSPDTASSSPLSLPQALHAPSPDRLGHTPSIAEGINRGFASAQSLSDMGRGVALNGASPLDSLHSVDEAGTAASGQSLVDVMSSKFEARLPPTGMRIGNESEAILNSTVRKMKEELMKKLEQLSPYLPTNTLDELIDGLGGTRSVAEMTGRRGRVVSLPGGGVQYQLRSEHDVTTELLNIRERQRFMDGDKDVAIISEAASSGISLQADRRARNQKRRVHITLELPWSADRAIQQFGRTHRSNQVSAPEYVFLISALSGEQRFASIVAKRLQSLGALTHGDRRATESRDLSKFNVDTKYGRQALEKTLKSVVGMEKPIVNMDDYPEDFFEDCKTSLVGVGLFRPMGMGVVSIDKDAMTMSRFLNRILGLEVQLQNDLFSYFSDTLNSVVQRAKRTNNWDGGIQDYGSSGEHVEIVNTEQFAGDPAYNVANTLLYTVEVERGMSFDEALSKLNQDTCPEEGFYATKKVRSNKHTAVLFKAADSSGKFFTVYRPSTGKGGGGNSRLSKLLKKYEKMEREEAKKWWTAQYESSLTVCSHAYWQGRCRNSSSLNGCTVGLRRNTYYVLCGSVLGVWSHIEGVFNRHAHNQRMQIVRVKTADKRLVGIQVPKACIEEMRRTLLRVSYKDEGTPDNPITL